MPKVATNISILLQGWQVSTIMMSVGGIVRLRDFSKILYGKNKNTDEHDFVTLMKFCRLKKKVQICENWSVLYEIVAKEYRPILPLLRSTTGVLY